MMTILIGISLSLTQEIPLDFKECLDNLKGDYEILFMRDTIEDSRKGTKIWRIARARDKIRSHFLKGSYTHLLFLDSDIRFPSNLLQIFLSFDKDIVTHTYKDHYEEREIRLGLGCSLIKRQVLEIVPEFTDGLIENEESMGEDVLFFYTARAMGFSIFFVHNLSISHCPYNTKEIWDQWKRTPHEFMKGFRGIPLNKNI